MYVSHIFNKLNISNIIYEMFWENYLLKKFTIIAIKIY